MEHIGGRVAAARKRAGLTQEALSVKLGFQDRQILSNVESGKRALAPEELVKLMEASGQDLEFFIDPYRLVGEGAFSFRADRTSVEDLDAFEERAGRWVAMYRRLKRLEGEEGGGGVSPYTLSLKLSHDSSYREAEDAGAWLSQEWELGPVPARKLVEAACRELDLLVLFVDAPEGISGAACRLKDLDTVIINRKDNPGRRMFDFAHELFHLLTWDRMPPARLDVVKPKASKAKRMEKLANAFASRLLMPADAVRRLWEERDREASLAENLARVADLFQVSSQAMYWRLVFDDLLPKDAVEDYTTLTDASRELPEPPLYSKPFLLTLHRALEEGVISARKAAKVLGMTLEEVGEVFDTYRLPRPYDL